VPQHFLSFTCINYILSCSPTSHYFLPACTVLSYSHFLTLLHSLTVIFLSRLLADITLFFHLVPFSRVVLTKSLVYLFVAFSVDRCDVTLAASYLLSDSIAILCRLPSVSLLLSSLLTSNRACLPPGSSTLVPWLLHAGYHIPQTNQ
jgi:hypothetical protein